MQALRELYGKISTINTTKFTTVLQLSKYIKSEMISRANQDPNQSTSSFAIKCPEFLSKDYLSIATVYRSPLKSLDKIVKILKSTKQGIMHLKAHLTKLLIIIPKLSIETIQKLNKLIT